MKFRKAKQDDKEEILALYQSLIGTPYCAWGNGYPGEQEFDYDMKRNALFCMENEDGEIIGTITVDEDPQVEALTCWSKTLQPSAELSRLGVRTDMQNQGIARRLLQHGMEELKKQGKTFYWSDIRKLSGVKKKNFQSFLPYLTKHTDSVTAERIIELIGG